MFDNWICLIKMNAEVRDFKEVTNSKVMTMSNENLAAKANDAELDYDLVRARVLRKTSLRKICEGMSAEQMDKIMTHLCEFMDERKQQEELDRQEEEAKREKLKQIQEEMRAANLTAEDLHLIFDSSSPKQGRKRAEVKKNYRCVDENGEEHLWSGRGRTPVAFIQAMEREGKDKEAFKIED